MSRAVDALCLVLLAAVAVGTGHLFLRTALILPETLAQAEGHAE
ncbi:MAG: hypothetical protein ACK4TJ_00795 [Tabrizicola sp.]